MLNRRKRLGVKFLALLAALTSLPYILARQQQPESSRSAVASQSSAAQQLESRLSLKADFIPRGGSALEQLIAVAQHYRIPMGIEVVRQKGSQQELDLALPSGGSGPTVLDLLRAVAARWPGYQVTTQNGVVNVANPSFASASANFLNLRIEEFRVRNENLFDADEKLHLSIDMTLHPDDYEAGYAGGYGYAPDDVLAKPTLTFSGEDLTVRTILDGLVKASGNALWVAEQDLEAPKAGTSPANSKSVGGAQREGAKSRYRWKFIPLVEKQEN